MIKTITALLWLIACMPVLLAIGFIFSFIYCLIKGYRFKGKRPIIKKRSFLKTIMIDFPLQFWKDKFALDPDEFGEDGLHLYCGEQGAGKTISVVERLIMLKEKYPKVKIRTNFNYAGQDDEIIDWRNLVKNENGIYGQIEVIDEIQTWFSSNQSKDFPPEMLKEICQQRKQRKMLIGTAQVFGRVAKPIREQVSRVYLPMTIAGCLTIVRVSKPHYYDDEKFRFKRYVGFYVFAHNEKIRNSFDTYKKIEGLVEAGFYNRSDLKEDTKIVIRTK